VINPRPSSPEASARLLKVRQRDTKPEIELRRALHAKGLRYRVQVPVLKKPRRTADIVFSSRRIAVFVDGCFWHSCPIHGSLPKSNAAFWRDKIETNMKRDEDTNERLSEIGWTPIRTWAHEDTHAAADRIEAVVRGEGYR
jgi:DNA mismatch endonuclease, patch repair protein